MHAHKTVRLRIHQRTDTDTLYVCIKYVYTIYLKMYVYDTTHHLPQFLGAFLYAMVKALICGLLFVQQV